MNNEFIDDVLLNLPIDLINCKIYKEIEYINDNYTYTNIIDEANVLLLNVEKEIDFDGYIIYFSEEYNTTKYQEKYDLIESHKDGKNYGFIFKKPPMIVDELLLEIRTREEEKDYDVLPLECSKETEKCTYSEYLQDCCIKHLNDMLNFISEQFVDFKWWCDKHLLMRINDNSRGKITDELEIGLFAEDYNKLLALRSTFLKNGYQFIINQKPREWIRIQVSGKNKIGIDIVPRRNINGVLYWGVTGGNKLYTNDSIPYFYVSNIINKELENTSVNIPNNSNDLLTYRYGSGYGDKAWTFEVKQLVLPEKIEATEELPKEVYVYWQGKENSIVSKCYDIIKNKCRNFNINLVSDECLETIYEKNPRLKNCSSKVKSLFAKINLLNETGGTWIDSDIIMMKDLEEIIKPIKKYDFVGFGEYYGNPDDAFMSCRKDCYLVNIWKRRFDMMLNNNVFNYDRLNYVFKEVSDNYKYYNYNHLLFDPFDDLSIYKRIDNGFVKKVKNEGKVNCFHLHSKTIKESIMEGTILDKLLS